MGYLGIAMIPLILIVAAIAIPQSAASTDRGNEALAATTVRSINTVQMTYQTTYPAIG
jgi:type II secretory pathway pseudopilin PulG